MHMTIATYTRWYHRQGEQVLVRDPLVREHVRESAAVTPFLASQRIEAPLEPSNKEEP